MATVACPGCGLPRAEAEHGTKPCPVCVAAPDATGDPRRSLAKRTSDADPTDGLPADASELHGPGAPSSARDSGSRARVLGAAMFFFGALIGVCGVLGVQALDGLKPDKNRDVTASASPPDEALEAQGAPKPRRPEVAPMPHEPRAKLADEGLVPEFAPAPRLVLPPAPSWRVITIDLGPNQQDILSVPFTMKNGEHVVLKGKVKTFRVPVLDGGAILDASGLEASTVTIGGKIDNKSTLKLNAPNGSVHITGKVDNKSVVEINAPGGEVKFMYLTTATKEGSKIDNGSKVTITGRNIEFKGDITGTDTTVSVVLTRNAWLKLASVSGKATVEYKPLMAGWSPPDVTVGAVAPTATFRKAGE